MHMKCKFCGSTQHEIKDCKPFKRFLLTALVIFGMLIFAVTPKQSYLPIEQKITEKE